MAIGAEPRAPCPRTAGAWSGGSGAARVCRAARSFASSEGSEGPGGSRREDHRRHPDAVRLEWYSRNAVRPAYGTVRRREPARAPDARHRRGHPGPRLSRLRDARGAPRRAVADPVPQARRARPGPDGARAAVPGDVAEEPGNNLSRDRRHGHSTLGHRGQGGGTADPPAAWLLSRERSRLRELGGPTDQGGVRRGGAAPQGRAW